MDLVAVQKCLLACCGVTLSQTDCMLPVALRCQTNTVCAAEKLIVAQLPINSLLLLNQKFTDRKSKISKFKKTEMKIQRWDPNRQRKQNISVAWSIRMSTR